MNDIVLANARLVLANEIVTGHVLVRDGRIVAVGSGGTSAPGAQDLEGDFLLPGLVEMHTDNLERHVMPRPKVAFPMQAAVQAHDGEMASAGITAVLDAIGVGDPYDEGFRSRDQGELLRVLDRLDAAGSLRVDHHIHVRAELPAPNALALFEPFQRHRRLRLISLMDHTPGQRQWTEIEHARVYYTGKKGWSNDKFAAEMRAAPARQAQYAEPHRRWFADFARRHDVALATHDDTDIAHVDQALALGAVMSGDSHSGNVAALELAREGVLTALSSDYVPASLLLAAWTLQRDAGFSLSEAVGVVSRAPAHACGFDDRGEIGIGLRADLVRARGRWPPGGARSLVPRAARRLRARPGTIYASCLGHRQKWAPLSESTRRAVAMMGLMMVSTDSWTCPRCRTVNPAGTDACGGCALAARAGARRLRRTDAMAALPHSPEAGDEAGWLAKESALLLPEIVLAAGLLVACPLWFIALLHQGHYIAATVLFIGIAPAMLLAVVAVRQKSAGGLYLTAWVTFVAIVVAGLVARFTA